MGEKLFKVFFVIYILITLVFTFIIYQNMPAYYMGTSFDSVIGCFLEALGWPKFVIEYIIASIFL